MPYSPKKEPLKTQVKQKVINRSEQKKIHQKTLMDFAEREGFEPPVPRGTTVFKTAAFDHSAISPNALQK